jgi:hypothetical protein
MTSSASNEVERAAQAVFVLFASINRSMLDIHEILSAKVAVGKVTHTCSVRRFPHDGGTAEHPEWFSFTAYVDVETKPGDGPYWTVELTLQAGQWTLDRYIERPGEHGSELMSDFDSATYASFAELQDGHAPLMAEFVRSAEAFAFPS